MSDTRHEDERRRLARAVREACVQAALAAYEEAGIAGLCHEGAWECAVSAIRRLDLEPLVAGQAPPDKAGSPSSR